MNTANKNKYTSKEIQICKNEVSQFRDRIEQKRENQCTTILKKVSIAQNIPPVRKLKFDVIKQYKGHNGKIYDSDWSYNSTLLLSASQDGHLMIWNAITTHKLMTFKLKSTWVMTCAFSPSSAMIACGGLDNLCSIYNLNFELESVIHEAPARKQLQHHEGYLSSIEFLNDRQIITASGDSTCVLWDIERKVPLVSFLDHTGDVTCVAVNNKSKHKSSSGINQNNAEGNDETSIFLSGSVDASIKLWDIRKKGCCGEFLGHDSDVNGVCWSPAESVFASGSDDATLKMFDIRSYKQLNEYSDDNIMAGVTSVSFSASGSILFAGYDEEPFALGWDAAYAQRTCKLFHKERVSTVQVSPNGHAICTSSWDKTLRLWVGK